MPSLLYIGIYSPGSTSRMRGEVLKDILYDWTHDTIDTSIPFMGQNKLSRSVGFRYKRGPVISAVNDYVLKNFENKVYDLVWVDKAIFLTKETTKILRANAACLVHFTPDPAFLFHRSKLFFESLNYYDFLITTKNFEIKDYQKVIGNNTIILYATQGFDKALHHPVTPFHMKKNVVFVGHYEKERAKILQALLNKSIPVTLTGIKWKKFVRQNKDMPLVYLGEGVFGKEYVKTISSGLFALGMVSKWIPEKHTTRTFEIPACGTALLTERNEEICSFFDESEVIFYSTTDELVQKILYYTEHRDELHLLTENGHRKVIEGGYDYKSIINRIVRQIGIQC